MLFRTSILNLLNKNFEYHPVGLYRDGGLKVIQGLLGRRLKDFKKIARIFKNWGLKIVISSNLHVVNYFGVTLGLRTNTWIPYIGADH